MIKIKLFEDFDWESYKNDRKDWFVTYGLGGGMNTEHYEVLEDMSKEDAEKIAWELTVEDYEMYAGMHGLRSWSDIEEELREEYDEEPSEDEVQEAYNEDIESWARYSVKPLNPNDKEQIENLEEEGVILSPRIKKLIYDIW
jgi:hypothetical protein